MRIISSGLTDVGKKRERNEDAFACSDELGLYLVADGMGGHAAGEVASKTAMSVIFGFVRSALNEKAENWVVRVETGLGRDQDALVSAVRLANQAICDLSEEKPQYNGMGTTIVGALIREGIAHIVHVGDSRVYALRQGELQALTTDHSWVNEQLQRNMITEEEARNHRWRNVITRALGHRLDLEIDSLVWELLPGDILLLCTDGLTTMVDDPAIAEVLLEAGEDLAGTCRRLADMSNEAGGFDNITIALLRAEKEED